jgi:uncharacterized protein
VWLCGVSISQLASILSVIVIVAAATPSHETSMDSQIWMLPLLGGALLGLSAGGLLLFNGRMAGVSGIVGGLVHPGRVGRGWRAAFLAGLIAGGGVLLAAYPEAFPLHETRSLGALAVAGLLVGFGARLGGGCTSGHGVCGVGRLSRRSLVATATFMVTGALTVLVVNRLLGGFV